MHKSKRREAGGFVFYDVICAFMISVYRKRSDVIHTFNFLPNCM